MKRLKFKVRSEKLMNLFRNCRLGILLIILISSFLTARPVHAVEYGLEDFYKLALERAERVKISEEDLFIAVTGKDKARSALLPKVSGFGSYTRYTEDKYSSAGAVIQPNESKTWGLRLDQSFSMSGREITGFNISKENIEKNKYDLHAVKEAYLLSVSVSYYEVLRAKKSLDIAKANVERLTKYRDAASIRLRVGEATKTVLLRAEAELSGAQSDEIRAKNALDSAKIILARLTGISGDYDVKESSESAALSAQLLASNCKELTVDCLKQAALSERAEIKSLEVQKKIGEAQIRYVYGSYWPTLSVEGVYSGKDEDPAASTLNKESIYGGLKINIPIFEGGLRAAEVREAEAKYRQAALIYEDGKKTVYVEVENAYLDLITQKGIMEKFEAQATYAMDNYNAVSKQFEHGLASSLDIIDANTLLVTAERQLADAKYGYQLSILRLKRSIGTLLKSAFSYQVSAVSQNREGNAK